MARSYKKKQLGDNVGVGRPTDAELNYIKTYGSVKTDEELSEFLKRPISTIKKLREKVLAGYDEKEQEYLNLVRDLHDKAVWPGIKRNLRSEEVKIFEYHWVNLMKQFNNDVYYSEEAQIIELIHFEIMGMRLFNEIKQTEEMEIDLEKKISDERKKSKDDINDQLIIDFSERLDVLRKSKGIYNKQILEFSKEKQELFTQLKATRDQRVKQFTDDNYTFPKLVKMLADEKGKQKHGRMLGLMKKAMDKEYEHLTESHRYDDGKYDMPLLTPDSVMKINPDNKPIDEEIPNNDNT